MNTDNEPTTILKPKNEIVYRTLTEAERQRIMDDIQDFHEQVKLCGKLLAWAIGFSLLVIWLTSK